MGYVDYARIGIDRVDNALHHTDIDVIVAEIRYQCDDSVLHINS
jgi:hypothetical protein